MKKALKLMSLFLVAGLFIFSSCKKDEEGTNNTNVAQGVISAKVDGNLVSTASMTGIANLVENIGTLTLQGNTAGTNSKAFVMMINGFDGAGTYAIGGENSIAVNASYTEIAVNMNNPMDTKTETWQAPYTGGAEVGKITVTEITDTYVKGTFEFKAKNSKDNSIKNITEGAFNLKLN